jgi:hypothetical protein
MKLIDLKNKKFNRLKVLELTHKNKVTVWKCKCDCGNITYVQGYALRKGFTKSCGCLNTELRKKRVNELNPFFKHGRSKTREYHREHERKRLLKKYSLTPLEYNIMLEKQNNRCAICNEFYTAKKLFVDHNHKNGLVRGLLCNRCNLLIGWANDSTDILEKAIKYLSKKENKRIEIGHMVSRSLIALQGQVDMNNINGIVETLYAKYQELVG